MTRDIKRRISHFLTSTTNQIHKNKLKIRYVMYKNRTEQYKKNISNTEIMRGALKVIQQKGTIQLIFISILHVTYTYMGQRRYTGCVAQPVHCDAK